MLKEMKKNFENDFPVGFRYWLLNSCGASVIIAFVLSKISKTRIFLRDKASLYRAGYKLLIISDVMAIMKC